MAETDAGRLEVTIRAFHDAGEFDRAAEAAVRGYGPEILGWLAAVMNDREGAQETFSAFCEDLWKGLPAFRWESSFRTWAYCLARNAWYRGRRSPRRKREVLVDDLAPMSVPAPGRSETVPWLKTNVKDRFSQLRDRLDTVDRMILVLRVDRQMSWDDMARIVSGEEGTLTADAVRKKATALRQHFQRLKGRLRDLALQEGLLGAE